MAKDPLDTFINGRSIRSYCEEAFFEGSVVSRFIEMNDTHYPPVRPGVITMTGQFNDDYSYAYREPTSRIYKIRATESHFNTLDLLRLAYRFSWNVAIDRIERSDYNITMWATVPIQVAEDFVGSLPPFVEAQSVFYLPSSGPVTIVQGH